MVRLTTSQIAAHCCTVIFMINPAGIFFNSCYTESAYFCFFITGFYFLVTERPNSWMATFCFTIASGIRSNGILNAGFIAHFSIHSIAQAYYADLGILKGKECFFGVTKCNSVFSYAAHNPGSVSNYLYCFAIHCLPILCFYSLLL